MKLITLNHSMQLLLSLKRPNLRSHQNNQELISKEFIERQRTRSCGPVEQGGFIEIQTFDISGRNTYNQRPFNKSEDYTKFVEEELNRFFQNRSEIVVVAMKNIIVSESKVSISFKNLSLKQ